MNSSRRIFVRDLGKGIVVVAAFPAICGEVFAGTKVQPTSSATEGPFYLPDAPFRSNLREAGEKGMNLRVAGSIVDPDGRAIPKALIEIWHTDASGDYDLRGFRHRASLLSTENGVYRFDTIMPDNYGGRPKHIHYKISADGFRPLTTQLYFENDSFFEGNIAATLEKDPFVHRDLIRPVSGSTVEFPICLAR